MIATSASYLPFGVFFYLLLKKLFITAGVKAFLFCLR